MQNKEARISLFHEINDAELRLAEKRGSKQSHTNLHWLGMLMEIIGNLSRSILEGLSWEIIRGRLIQCVAVIFAWIEDKDK